MSYLVTLLKALHRPLFLYFSHTSGTPHPIDTNSTVTCLVHGHAAESRSVTCRLELFCCCNTIEIPDPPTRFPHSRRDKSLLTHWSQRWSMRTNPSRTLVLVHTQVSSSKITTDSDKRSGTRGGTRSFFCRKLLRTHLRYRHNEEDASVQMK